jgi:hypothetical protein
MKKNLECTHSLPRSFSHDTDASVRLVSHPPDKAKSLGLAKGEVAIADALHTPGNDGVEPDWMID